MKVFIAIPSYTGTIAAECVLSVVGLIGVLNSELGVQSILSIHSYNGNVADARNRLVQGFLQSDCTHMLFVDDDMQFNPVDILEMFRAVVAPPQRNEAIMAALCPRKNIQTGEAEYNLYSPLAEEYHGERVVVQVDRVGTGIMIIPRHSFDVLTSATACREADGLQQFFVTIMGVEELSEDYYFCESARACGVNIYLAMWTDVKHIGRYAFGGF